MQPQNPQLSNHMSTGCFLCPNHDRGWLIPPEHHLLTYPMLRLAHLPEKENVNQSLHFIFNKKNTTDLSDFNTEEQWDETKQKEISH